MREIREDLLKVIKLINTEKRDNKFSTVKDFSERHKIDFEICKEAFTKIFTQKFLFGREL